MMTAARYGSDSAPIDSAGRKLNTAVKRNTAMINNGAADVALNFIIY